MVKVDGKKYKDYAQPKTQNPDEEENDVVNDQDTSCGFGGFRPQWLQIFASKKVFSFVYSIFGLILYGEMSVFQGSLSSLEKNFSVSAKAIGSIKTINHAVGVITTVTGYAADRGNRIRWIAFAALFYSIGCLLCIIPIFSPVSIQNINTYRTMQHYDNITTFKKLNEENSCGIESDNYNLFHYSSILLIVIGQALIGYVVIIHRMCGMVYLDTNIRKNVFPVWYAAIYSTEWIGYALGLVMTSYALKFFVFPTSKPNITNTDPRWIGAWWLGFLLLGGIGLLLFPIFLLFPKSLPRAAMRKQEKSIPQQKMSCADFFTTLKRVFRNKILMLDTLSKIAFVLGYIATFWPKYIEIQYGMTPSKSNIMQALIEFVGRPSGVFIISIIMVKFKPPPRVLLGYNLFTTIIAFLSSFLLIFTGCGTQTISGHEDATNNWILTEECNVHYNCSADIKYAPVCDTSQNKVFFSSCHAGCQFSYLKNNKTIFDHCDCVSNSEYLEEGLCYSNCAASFTTYLILLGIIKTIKASSSSTQAIVAFRSMEDRDKSFSTGVARALITIFSTIPGLVIYGSLIDASCLVWDNKCGTKGNCWLYDTKKLRHTFFITSTAFMGIAVILDILLYISVRTLKLYDEDFTENVNSDKKEYMKNGEIMTQMLKEGT